MTISHPAPIPDSDDETWWTGLSDGLFLVPQCTSCERGWMRPTPTCPRCGSRVFEFRSLERSATIYSWTIIERALDPSFEDETPVGILLVEWANGARVFARLLDDVRRVSLAIGDTVSLEPYQDGEWWLPGARVQGATTR